MRGRNPTERARARVAALQESGRALAEREDDLRHALYEAETAGGLRLLANRRVARAQRRLGRAAEERERRVRAEFDEILHGLQAEALRAGAELDAVLEPLERLRARWADIGTVFGELEETIRTRELAPFLSHWDGALGVPEFPVTARDDDRHTPFPPSAFVF